MKDNEKTKLFEENLKKFKHRIGYKINESPKYRPLVDDTDEFDELPITEVGDQEDAPKPEGDMQREPDTEKPIGAETPVPGFEDGAGDDETIVPPPEGETPPGADTMPPIDGPPVAEPQMGVEPETPPVDDIQNEIIKHNIEAMKSINDQLKSLTDIQLSLSSKVDELNADVEEVREPTNAEKLMNKTNVSYPYYFNLNDFWKGNWFNEKYNDEVEKGIKKLPDGSFVADFDDLPQKSKIDVQNSFNKT